MCRRSINWCAIKIFRQWLLSKTISPAKAQRRKENHKFFLCAFAPLREKMSDMSRPVSIKRLASVTNAKLAGDETTVVTDVSHDSRRVSEGTLFAAVTGALFDAHKFIPQVMEQGASGVLSERPAPEGLSGAWLQVENIRRAMALAAAEVQNHPSRELQLVGITGTNGKNTTAHLI